MKTPNNIRLGLVYSDEEFEADALGLLKDYVAALRLSNLDSEFIANVLDGYVRRSSIEKFTPEILGRYETLLDEYSISEEEFINYFTNAELVGDTSAVIDIPNYDDPIQTYKISVPVGTTFEDVKKSFEGIAEMRKALGVKVARRRGPADPKLLYRIRRLKVRGYTYPEIAELYSSDNIPHYSRKKGSQRSYTAAEIAQYYSDYSAYVVKPSS
ncbi:MAG: hypothetical protein JWO54_297 [Candidatus Saccharibacteria bacterium]|nr:hypothetical protein [Candidatus Saccharibacteria bacterium]